MWCRSLDDTCVLYKAVFWGNCLQVAAADAARKAKEVRAREARDKLERLKDSWKESQALQAAAAAGDSTQIRKKKVFQ